MDDDIKFDRYLRSTWQCSKCGGRHRMSENVCPCCLAEALDEDQKKLDALRN